MLISYVLHSHTTTEIRLFNVGTIDEDKSLFNSASQHPLHGLKQCVLVLVIKIFKRDNKNSQTTTKVVKIQQQYILKIIFIIQT